MNWSWNRQADPIYFWKYNSYVKVISMAILWFDLLLPGKTKNSVWRRKKYYPVKIEKYEDLVFQSPEFGVETPDWRKNQSINIFYGFNWTILFQNITFVQLRIHVKCRCEIAECELFTPNLRQIFDISGDNWLSLQCNDFDFPRNNDLHTYIYFKFTTTDRTRVTIN